MKMLSRLVALAILIAAGWAGYSYWKTHSGKEPAKAADSVPTEVARGSIFQAVSSTGRVVSNRDVDIKCRASGQVIELPFDVSQHVNEGDLLLKLDPVDQQRAVSLSEVTLSEAQAKLAQAKQSLVVAQQAVSTSKDRAGAAVASAEIRSKDARARADRRKQLLDQRLGSQEDYDTSETDAAQAAADLRTSNVMVEEAKTQELALEVKRQDVALAEAQVASDQISLANMRQQLEYTTVTSPIDGVISAQNIQIGTIISSGITNIGGGTTILTVSDLSHVFVLASVDESEIGKVKLDQPVNVTADAYPGRKFHGQVVRIATKGVNVSNVVTFEVKIEVMDEKKTLLKPEMTANVQIIAAQKDDVPVVPAAAVVRKQGKLYATVVGTSGVNEEREIQVGLGDGERWEIVKGLAEGETVVVRNEAQSKWRADQNRPNMPGMGMPGMPGMGGRPGGGGARGGGPGPVA
jgi:RND family efflux transporter MFP subunit